MWSSSDDALLNMYGHVRSFRNPILLDVFISILFPGRHLH